MLTRCLTLQDGTWPASHNRERPSGPFSTPPLTTDALLYVLSNDIMSF